jgi:hypothetical protein
MLSQIFVVVDCVGGDNAWAAYDLHRLHVPIMSLSEKRVHVKKLQF